MSTQIVRLRENVALRLQQIHNLDTQDQVAALLKITPEELAALLKGETEPTTRLIAQIMASGLGAAEVIRLCEHQRAAA